MLNKLSFHFQMWIFIFSILLLSSCRKLVQSDFPYFAPVPVVNSILSADSLLKAHISLASKLDTIDMKSGGNSQAQL